MAGHRSGGARRPVRGPRGRYPDRRQRGRLASASGRHSPGATLNLGRFYIALVGGRENRSASRLAVERGRHPLAGGANLAVIGALAAVLALAGFGLYGLL